MSRWNLAWLLGVSAITLVGLSIAYSFSNTPLSAHDKHDNVRLLIEVMDEVQSNYVKSLDKKKMREFVENMVNGGLEKLDPHSGFMNAEEYKEFMKHSDGKFGGVGIRIRVDSAGQIMVETPIVGTPAYNAGIMAGDVIVKVDGKTTEQMSVKEVVEMIQGEPDTKVTLTVVHEGETKENDIEMTRAQIKIDSILGDTPVDDPVKKWEYVIDKQNRIAYIRLVAFTQTTLDELKRVVQDLQDEGVKGFIIDLRNNPGGLLKSAVQVSGMFLESGKKVVSTKSRTQTEESYNSKPPAGVQPITSPPLVILINRYSASASEIVAAALQDHLRAIIVGERSFGKGSVQNIIETEGRTSALKLTTASYWRPSGKNMHRFPDSKREDDWGVTPDVEVKIDTKELIDYFKYRREKDVLHKPGWKNGDKEKILQFKDRVLEKGLEVVVKKLKGQKDAAAPAPAKSPLATLTPVPAPKTPVPAKAAQSSPAAPRELLWCHEDRLAPLFTTHLCHLDAASLAPRMEAIYRPEMLPIVRAAPPRLLA